MAFDRKAYMHRWNRDPEKVAIRKAAHKKYRDRPEIKEKMRAWQRARNATPKGRAQQKARQLKRNYGMTIDQYNEMAVAQHYRCKICGAPAEEQQYGKLHVDHDHQTDEIRGLLCSGCNTGLGQFKENPDTLELAAAYLRKINK